VVVCTSLQLQVMSTCQVPVLMIMLHFATTAHTSGQIQFTETPSNVSVKYGDSATLHCVADSVNVAYVWIKGGMALALPMNESSRLHLYNGSLVINNIIDDDEDEYVCMVLDLDTGKNITSDSVYITVISKCVCVCVCTTHTLTIWQGSLIYTLVTTKDHTITVGPLTSY